MFRQTVLSVLQTIFFTALGMLASSLLALLIVKIRKWYLIRKTLNPQPVQKGKTLQQYIEQIDSIRYVDEWPPTERMLDEVVVSSKSPSTVQTVAAEKSFEKTMDKSEVIKDIIGRRERETVEKLNKTLPV